MLYKAVVRFIDDDAFTLGAALAYYSLLSIAPLLLVAVSLAGAFFADGDVRMDLVDQMRRLTGPEGAALTQTVIDHTMSKEASLWSLLVGATLTLFGATTVFAQLQHALNRVWRVAAVPGNAIVSFIRQRLLSFAIVLVIGFLLMVSLLISAVLGSLHAYLEAIDGGRLPTERGVLRTDDDRVRGEIIRRIMCRFALDLRDVERIFKINFRQSFAPELGELGRLSDDGLVTVEETRIQLTPLGRVFVRNVASIFDAHRHPAAAGAPARFSMSA